MSALPKFTAAKVLVVGDVMLDRYWFGDVHRISPEAPVPVLKVERVEERPGGAANVARNIAALGANSTLLSVLGDDEAGDCLEKLLTQHGNVKALLHRDSSISTISVVFPDAALKIFLTASAQARADRRYKQLKQKGMDANIAALLQDIEARDYRDTQRSVAPLQQATGAILLDTTALNIEQAVGFVMQHYPSSSKN